MKDLRLGLAAAFFLGLRASITSPTRVSIAFKFLFCSSEGYSFDSSSWDYTFLRRALTALSFSWSLPIFSCKCLRAGSQCLTNLACFFSRNSIKVYSISSVFYSFWGAIKNSSGAFTTWALRASAENSCSFIAFWLQPCLIICVVWLIGLAFTQASTPCWATRARNCLSATHLLRIVYRVVSINVTQLSSIFKPFWLLSPFLLNSSLKSSSELRELLDLRFMAYLLMKVPYLSIDYWITAKWNLFKIRRFKMASYWGLHSSSLSICDI